MSTSATQNRNPDGSIRATSAAEHWSEDESNFEHSDSAALHRRAYRIDSASDMCVVERVVSGIKIIGSCSICDKEVFDIIERFGPSEERAGTPKRIGAPHDDAMRIGFMLASGEQMDLTFCQSCAESLTDEDYHELWQKVLRSWVAELGDRRPEWLTPMLGNGILCELGKETWKDVLRSAH